MPDVILSAYFTRYLNESMLQTGWNGGAGDGPYPATSTTVNTIGSGSDSTQTILDVATFIKLKLQ